jgi:hypothetical protein
MYQRLARAVLAAALVTGSTYAAGQPQAQTASSLKTIEEAVATKVSHTLARQFAFCELRSAVWGQYDVSVRVGTKATAGGKPLIFQITKGKFIEEPDPDTSVDYAKVKGRGHVNFASKEAAFAQGVPFFISDVSLTSPTELKYTVHSNPSVQVAEAMAMAEFDKGSFSGTALEAGKPFSSKAEPQTRIWKSTSPLDPTDKNRFQIVTQLGQAQGCLVSNSIDLNTLVNTTAAK